MKGHLDMLANRRAHLVAALAFTAGCFAIAVARTVEVDTLSRSACAMCGWLAWAMTAIVVGVLTKKREHFVLRAIFACAAAGAFVAVIGLAGIANERPMMQLSFDGHPIDAVGVAVLGLTVGAIFGALVGAFAEATRPLTEKAPELVCAAAWSLAVAASIAARNWWVLVPCALGIAIQLASVRRVRVVMPVRPYR